MDKQTKELLIGTLAVTVAVVSLYLAFGGRSQKVNVDVYEALGAVTAEETAKLIGGKGQVLVIVRDTGADENPSAEAQLKAFQRALKKQAGLSEVIEKIPITPTLMMATGGGAPPEQFFKALAAHTNSAALVLFFGFPALAEAELEALKKTGIKTVVVSSLRSGYKQLLERQSINLAIVPRSDTPPGDSPTPRTLRERFDQEFSIITPAEAARLP